MLILHTQYYGRRCTGSLCSQYISSQGILPQYSSTKGVDTRPQITTRILFDSCHIFFLFVQEIISPANNTLHVMLTVYTYHKRYDVSLVISEFFKFATDSVSGVQLMI